MHIRSLQSAYCLETSTATLQAAPHVRTYRNAAVVAHEVLGVIRAPLQSDTHLHWSLALVARRAEQLEVMPLAEWAAFVLEKDTAFECVFAPITHEAALVEAVHGQPDSELHTQCMLISISSTHKVSSAAMCVSSVIGPLQAGSNPAQPHGQLPCAWGHRYITCNAVSAYIPLHSGLSPSSPFPSPLIF